MTTPDAFDAFDQALQAISAEIQNRQVKVSELQGQIKYLDGEIAGLRTAQDRIERVRSRLPKQAVDPLLDPITRMPVP